MPDVKITELPVVTTVAGSDVLPVVASNTTSQISIANLANSIASNGVTGSLLMSGSIIPAVEAGSYTSSFSLGSATNAWNDLWISNGTINFINGAGTNQGTLSSTATGLSMNALSVAGIIGGSEIAGNPNYTGVNPDNFYTSSIQPVISSQFTSYYSTVNRPPYRYLMQDLGIGTTYSPYNPASFTPAPAIRIGHNTALSANTGSDGYIAAFSTIISSNANLSTLDTTAAVANSNGINHVLAVTGSLLSRDNTTLGTVATNRTFIRGTATVSGSMVVSGSLLMSGSIIPNVGAGSSTSSFSLGSATNAWKDLWVSNGTINFLNGAGVSQGTLSSTAGGLQLGNSQLTGSFTITPSNRYNTGSTSYFVAEIQAKPSKALSIFTNALGAEINGDLLAVQNIYSALPFDKTYNAYYIMNNGRIGDAEPFSSSLVLSLPPWINTRMAPGETITVYNMSTGSNLINNGEIYIVSMLQGVNAVDTAGGQYGYANRVSSYFNNGALLSGSWSSTGNPLQNYVNINPSYTPATTHSIAIRPGQKGIFELMQFPNAVDTLNPAYYNGYQYPTTGSYDSTYTGGGSIYMGYRFVKIENL